MADIINIADQYVTEQTALHDLAVKNNDLMVKYYQFFSQDDKIIKDTMEDNKVMLDKGADVQRQGDDLKNKMLTIHKELIAAYKSETNESLKKQVIDKGLALHKKLNPTNESSDEDIKNNFTKLLEGKIQFSANGNSSGGRRKSRSKKRSTRLRKKTRSRSRR
jgi:hypothetical protein